ncbi:hypothetical protein CKA32_004792 [Geitlerinema sp. FC II]|nr:hypothetical protein CKA32_004792 [Geitlerinema sp. FC II]
MRKTGAIETSEGTAPGIVIDDTEQGQIVAIEVLDASERLPLPLSLEPWDDKIEVIAWKFSHATC